MNPHAILTSTAKIALGRKNGHSTPKYNYFLACTGIRHDGVLVHGHNSYTTQPSPETHAEIRMLRKLGHGKTVFVVRVGADGGWRMARPCPNCTQALIKKGVTRVYYTIGPGEFGTWRLQGDQYVT